MHTHTCTNIFPASHNPNRTNRKTYFTIESATVREGGFEYTRVRSVLTGTSVIAVFVNRNPFFAPKQSILLKILWFYESYLLNICSTPELGKPSNSVEVVSSRLYWSSTLLQGNSYFSTIPKIRLNLMIRSSASSPSPVLWSSSLDKRQRHNPPNCATSRRLSPTHPRLLSNVQVQQSEALCVKHKHVNI